MLHIPPHSLKILKAKQGFRAEMVSLIEDRINGLQVSYDADLISVFDYVIRRNLDKILISEPVELLGINSLVNQVIEMDSIFKEAVKYVFNYDWFCVKKTNMYCAYTLANALGIDTCVYCNRNYTSTVIKKKGEKITRPQFDHFFDKASNPLLAVSFYNLIPSCSICNSSIKGSEPMSLSDHMHPYIDDNLVDITFSYKYSADSPSGLRIKVKTPKPSKVFNTVELLAVEEVYNAHTSELKDLLRVKSFFSDRYLDILNASLLKGIIASKADLYRVVFGAEYAAEDFVKRPFSKFKSDILKELGVI